MVDGPHNDKVSAYPHQPKETRAFQDTLAGERYTFPNSNPYAVLSTMQDQIYRNFTPNPDQNSASYIFSPPSKKHKLQPKACPTVHKKNAPTSITVHQNLQVPQTAQDIFTIPYLLTYSMEQSPS